MATSKTYCLVKVFIWSAFSFPAATNAQWGKMLKKVSCVWKNQEKLDQTFNSESSNCGFITYTLLSQSKNYFCALKIRKKITVAHWKSPKLLFCTLKVSKILFLVLHKSKVIKKSKIYAVYPNVQCAPLQMQVQWRMYYLNEWWPLLSEMQRYPSTFG